MQSSRAALALSLVITAMFGATPGYAAPQAPPRVAAIAPADEYFGLQRLSILGIGNILNDLKVRYDGTAYRADLALHLGKELEEAMHDWARRYPGDRWLAHDLFRLEQVYMRVPTLEGHLRAHALADWIIQAYPSTYYAHYLVSLRAYDAKRHAPQPLLSTASTQQQAPTLPSPFMSPLPAAPTALPLPSPSLRPLPAPSATLQPASSPLPSAITIPLVRPSVTIMSPTPFPSSPHIPQPQQTPWW